MRVLVDTSVWSVVLRRQKVSDGRSAKILTDLIEGSDKVVLTGIVLQEILQGLRQESQFKQVYNYLEPFPILAVGKDTFVLAAKIFNGCQKKGIQASTIDCTIAAVAIENDCFLFTEDKDFQRIAGVSELRLF